MNKGSKERLISLGFGAELIDKMAGYSLNLSGLRGQNKAALLRTGFSEAEVSEILGKTNRKPIETVENIIRKSGGCCAYCADGNHRRPYELHHIEEYYLSQNNDEHNLLLVCPTHHTAIHKSGITTEEQISTKRSWEQIWKTAQFYQQKGIAFPFSSFEYLDYEKKGHINEIFSFRAPSPSICLTLMQEGLKTDSRNILEKQHKLLLAGSSGSGKSTLARGIGGIDRSYATFNYVASRDSSKAVSEIATFFSVTTKRVNIIIDNANTSFSADQIEQLLAFATEEKHIILIYTRGKGGDENRLESHFVDAVFAVDWTAIKPGIITKLLEYEAEVIKYLNESGINRSSDHPIGSSRDHRSLKQALEQYATSVETAWQFIYMLTNGIERIDNLQVELRRDEKMDIPVLFLCIKQIAQIEMTASVDEIMSLYNVHPALNTVPPPEPGWLQGKLSNLVDRQILKMQRGRYTTVHRQFAIRLIEHCHFKSRTDTEVLLNQIFSDPARIKEIVLLWSWLRNTTARNYVEEWYRGLDLDSWQALVDAALADELMTVSILSELMHRISVRGFLPLQECFKNKAQSIADLVNRSDKLTLYYLRDLYLNLHHDCPEVIKGSLDLISKEHIANLIKDIEPEHFEYLTWLFNTIVSQHPQWADEFSRLFNKQDFIKLIKTVKKGDITTLMHVIEFERTYIYNITRSHFRFYTSTLAQLLEGCHLQEINVEAMCLYRGYFIELFIYPKEIEQTLLSLDKKKLSRDFEQSSPRHWGNLLTLAILSQNIETDIIKNIVDDIDTVKLGANIAQYTDQYYYELRLLIHQLAYGSDHKKAEFADMLRPIIDNILKQRDAKDITDVLEAFLKIDSQHGAMLFKKHGMEVPELKSPSMSPSILKEAKANVEHMDAEGLDYEMENTRFKYNSDSVTTPYE